MYRDSFWITGRAGLRAEGERLTGISWFSSKVAAQIEFAFVYRQIDETVVKPPKGLALLQGPKIKYKKISPPGQLQFKINQDP